LKKVKRVQIRKVLSVFCEPVSFLPTDSMLCFKGMVLVHPSRKPRAVWSFDASVLVLHHEGIKTRYQVQSAAVIPDG
jgi:GTPase